jgi:hypothetical protein
MATTMTTVGALTRFPTAINPTLFSHELEYLYTGKNFGAAFEFLFDALDSKPQSVSASFNQMGCSFM